MEREEKLALVIVADEFFFNNEDLLFCKNIESPSKAVYSFIKTHSMTPKRFSSENWIDRYENLQFFKLFRMKKATYYQLVAVIGTADIENILSVKYRGGHHPIDLQLQMLVFLWFMATQDTTVSIGDRFKMSPATIMAIVNKILFFTLKLKKQYIIFPRNENELESISRGFPNYPGTVGAIDGSHIFLKVKKAQQSSYIDRYRRQSINLMAICDSNRIFTYVFVGFPGSAHDSRVFENSTLFREIERKGAQNIFFDDEKYHLIGDSAFALRKWLMTPYKGTNLTRKQKKHNYMLSSERVAIEHCFGILKGRWRRLIFVNTYNMCKAIEIVTAACVVHNFCIRSGDIWEDEEAADCFTPNEDTNDSRAAKKKRDKIADVVFNL